MFKKIIDILLKSFFISVFFVAGACAQKTQTSSRSSGSAPIEGQSEETVRKDGVEDDSEDIEKTSESAFNIKPKLDSLVSVIAEKNKEVKYAVGYRITVFNDNSRAAFDRAKEKIKELLPDIRIYDTFTNPTYRIKVGDFTDRTDALSPYLILKKEFPAARLIRDRVNLVK